MEIKKIVERNSITCKLTRMGITLLRKYNLHITMALFIILLVSLFNRDYFSVVLTALSYISIQLVLGLSGLVVKVAIKKFKELQANSDDVIQSSLEILRTPELASDIEMLRYSKVALENLYEEQRKITNACLYLCDNINTVDVLSTSILRTIAPLAATTLNYEILSKQEEMRK